MVDPLRAAREAAREIGAALRAAAAQVQAAIREFALSVWRAIARVLAAIRDMACAVWRAVAAFISFCVDVVVGFARWFCRQVATVYNLAVGLVADVIVFLRVFAPTIVAIAVWWFWRRWELLLFAGMWIVTILVALAIYGPRAKPENAPPRPRWAVIAGHVVVIALLLASQIRFANRYVVPIVASLGRHEGDMPTPTEAAGARPSAREHIPDRSSRASSRAASGARLGSAKRNPRDGAVMVYVPAGEFTMGSDGAGDEKPRRTVYLDGFWMYRTEVTVGQYRKFCSGTGRDMPDPPSWGWKDDHPVVNVTWDDAKAYADWAGVSLPTEAQWEKAARGTGGREYPWGNTFDASKAVCSVGLSRSSTAPVGSIPSGASPCGCLDMAGNVWEWCADWYDSAYYARAPHRNPENRQASTYRVLRGGSWILNLSLYLRAANRLYVTPGLRGSYLGFRCSSGRG